MGVFSGVGFVLRGWVASANPPAAPRRPRGGDRLRESSQWRKRAFERQKILFIIHSGTGNRQSMRFFTVASGSLWEGGRFLHFPPASGLALGLLLPTHAFWTNRYVFGHGFRQLHGLLTSSPVSQCQRDCFFQFCFFFVAFPSRRTCLSDPRSKGPKKQIVKANTKDQRVPISNA